VHSEQNHSIDVLHATIQHPVLVQPRNLALPESDSQNLEFADSEALLKISDKKAYQITLKITAHENCVALSNHFINH
jgi:P pilus assembly chaperone PapD